MAELPIKTHKRVDAPGLDGSRWRVWLEEDVPLIADLSESQQVIAGLSAAQLHERLPAALQRYASGRLSNDVPVINQVLDWDSPIVLQAEHFD